MKKKESSGPKIGLEDPTHNAKVKAETETGTKGSKNATTMSNTPQRVASLPAVELEVQSKPLPRP